MAQRQRKAWKRGAGSVRKIGARWYIRFSYSGKRHEEGTQAQSRKEAEAILRNKLDGLDSGRMSVQAHQTQVRDLWDPLKTNYQIKGQRVQDLFIRWKHLEPVFANEMVRNVTHTRMEQYVMARFNEGAAPATVQREIACLRRMIRLGAKSGLVSVLPIFPSIYVDNARQIFWEPEEFNNILGEVPDYLRPLLVTEYWTGLRANELLKLEWRHVDLESGRIELDRQMTKNKAFKTLYLHKDALRALTDWRKNTEDLMAATHTIVTHVFHRNGKPIKSYRTAWDNARRRLGLQGKVFHDFRRTLTRHLRDAGVDDVTSMKITGHKTRSVFDRYNIRDERDVKNAAEKLSRLA